MKKEDHHPEKKSWRDIFNKVSRKDIPGIAKDTLKDLKKPKEALALVFAATAGLFIPGAWIGYIGYRVYQYHHKNKKDGEDPDIKKGGKDPAGPPPIP